MAESRSTVELVFQGIDRTGEATQAALRNAERFSGGLQSATQPLADFTKNALAFEAALLAGGAAITAFSIKVAGDFDSAFREISTLIDEPVEALGEFREEILAYGQSSTQSLDQVTQAIYSAISAGVDYTDSLDAVSAAEQLSVAGKADLQESLIVLVSSLNAYGLGMDSAEEFSDALFTTVEQGQTTLTELAGSLSQVTGLAANAGVDFQELLAAIAALTATGAPTSQAITGIRSALSNIIRPTKEAEEVAQSLGIEFNAAALESRGFQGVLQDVAEATGGNTAEISRLFGSVEGLNSVLTLTGTGAEGFADSLQAMEQSSGAVGTAFDKMAGDVGQSTQLIQNALRNVLIQIGGPLLDEYGDVAQAIASVFNAIGREVSEGELGELVEFIEGLMGDIAETVAQLAGNIPEAFENADISGFKDGIEEVLQAVADLFRNFDLDTPEGLTRAINSISTAFEALSQFSAAAIGQLQPIFDAIGGNTEALADFAEKWSEIGGAIGGLATIINAVLPSVDVLIGLVGSLAAVVGANQGLSLVTSIRNAQVGLAALAKTLGVGGAVAAAAVYLGLKIKDLIEGLEILAEQERLTNAANEAFAVSSATVGDRLERISERLGITVSSMDDLRRLAEANVIEFDELTGLWVRSGGALQDFAGKSVDTEQNLVDLKAGMAAIAEERGIEIQGFGNAVDDLGDSADRAGESAEGAAEKTGRWIESTVDGVRTFTQLPGSVGDLTGDINRDLEELTNTSEEFQIAMRQIASEEYIATIQAQVELDAAALEAETQRVEAAFESINTSIESTGQLLGDLFGAFAGTSGLDQLFIQRQIEREQERRDQAFEQQQELTQAQIDALQERTRQLQQGNALIEVDGSGLQPHLEAFMFEILRSIQLRVNEDGLDMLLGVGN